MTTYLIHHYADEHPYKTTPERIISMAQDDGYDGDDIQGAIDWLNDGGNITVWADENREHYHLEYYDPDAIDSEPDPKYLEDYI